ncbi:MAG: hypothetical protein MUF72_16335 [Elainella sp. Prado103]|jgi:hypothetical protein|nr:hypothetical protein [Elainella sp. Prado103]
MSQNYKFDADKSTQAGLRLWVAFILGFWLVGFRAEVCILLGAIGGLATWRLINYWTAEKVELKDKPKDETPPPSAPPPISPLGRVLRKPAERFRRLGSRPKLPPGLPKLPERKPPKRI